MGAFLRSLSLVVTPPQRVRPLRRAGCCAQQLSGTPLRFAVFEVLGLRSDKRRHHQTGAIRPVAGVLALGDELFGNERSLIPLRLRPP